MVFNMARGVKVQFKEEWCQMLIDHIADGFSFESFGGDIGCGRTLLYEMLAEYPQFKAAKETGESMDIKKCEQYLKAHIAGAKTSTFDSKRANLNALLFKMKTRHYKVYGDILKHELKQDEEQKIKIDLTESNL